MDELHNKWPELFDETSSHKFRHPRDMQFSFSYFYYLMNARMPYHAADVFEQLDTDKDGYLNALIEEVQSNHFGSDLCTKCSSDDDVFDGRMMDCCFMK